MIYELNKKRLIDKNAIFINGQSGDFISGNHIPDSINNNTNNLNLLLEEYILKHNKYWSTLLNMKQINIVKELLFKQINQILK